MAYPRYVIDPETTRLVTYESNIKSGTHGEVYQKQLAQVLLLRLTRKGKNFQLAYEMTSAEKFDDVVLYDEADKQWIFLQSKHAHGKDSKIDINGLLPKSNWDKGDFSLYKYFHSYMIVRNRFKGKKNFILFTNKKLDEKLKSAGAFMSIEDRDIDNYLRFTSEGATHKLLTPTESTIQTIMKYTNKDFFSLKDAIKALFTEGTITKELLKYKDYLNDILKQSENYQIRFKDTFNDSLIFIAKLYKALQPELADSKPIKKPQELVIEEEAYESPSYPSMEGRDFEHLIEAIKDLFRSGIASDYLKKYGHLLALILTTTANGQLAFKDTFNSDIICKAELYRILKAELSNMDKEVTTDQKLFIGPDSPNKHNPMLLYAEASDVRQFFTLLTLSVHQPYELEPIIVEELHSWMRKWLRPDVLGKLTEDDDKNAVKCLDDYFDATLKCAEGNSKKYLTKDFVTEYLDKFMYKIVELYPVLNETNQLYINRVLVFEKEVIDAPKIWQDAQFDENVEFELDRSSGRVILPTARNRRDMGEKLSFSGGTYEEMTDSQFAANLRTRFSRYQCLVLTADPGLGKTALLQYIALEHQSLTSGAVFLFYLTLIQNSRDVFDNASSLDILKSALSQKNVELLQNVLQNNSDNQITMLFDGYDEIHKTNKHKVNKLFKLLLKSQHIQLVISVRNHEKNILRSFLSNHKLKVGYFTLNPFSGENIIEYLAQSWNEKPVTSSKFNSYCKFLIEKFYTLCRVPLMVKMMAETYKDGFEQFKASSVDKESEISYLEKEFLEVEHVYEVFIRNCLLVKIRLAYNDVEIVDSNRQILDGFYLDHQLLAIDFLDVTELKFIFKNPKYLEKWDSIRNFHLNQFEKSIIVKFVDDKVVFFHYSYAEYFVAKFLWDDFVYLQNTVKNVLSSFTGIRNFFIKIIEKKIKLFESINAQETSFVSNEVVYWACEGNAMNLLECALSKTFQLSPNIGEMFRIAIKNGRDKICSYLVDNLMVNPNIRFAGGRTPLYAAVVYKQNHLVQLLLDKGAYVNMQSEMDNLKTPLHLACEKGHKEVVGILLKEKAYINVLDKENWTPLHLACRYGHKDVVEMLIKGKAYINALNRENWTPLHCACHNGHKEIVELLISKNANVKALDCENWTPLHCACLNGHKEVVEILLRKKVNIHALDHENRTPLHYACRNGHEEVVEILLREKVKINSLDCRNWTPLHVACHRGHTEVVEILVREKANIDVLAYKSWTALHLACWIGNKEIVEILIRGKANINALAKKNYTPLHVACRCGHKEVVEILIRERANLDALEHDNCTPLHLACWNGQKEVVEILIREKANIEALAKKKMTPLHLASRYGHEEVVEILIREKAKIDALDHESFTPLHLACWHGHIEVVKLLIREKASIDILAQEKFTPFHLALRNDHREILNIFTRDFHVD